MNTSLQLVLLDFGACRTYEKEFMDKYIEIINAASEGNRDKVLELSKEIKFLTGYESKVCYICIKQLLIFQNVTFLG